MPGRIEVPDANIVDFAKRYDIYVAETQSRVVVYRNAFFRGMRELEERERAAFTPSTILSKSNNPTAAACIFARTL
jgi:hypothetical protein